MTHRAGRDAEFRAFVRTHHPDVGGDPDVFVAGLAAYGHSPRTAATPPITVVRSRSLAGRVRRLRRVLRRRPSRTTPLR